MELELSSINKYNVYYTRKLQYFIQFVKTPPLIYNNKDNVVSPSELKVLNLESKDAQAYTIALLNSSLFFWFFIAFSDCRNVNAREIRLFPAGLDKIQSKELNKLADSLLKNFDENSEFIPRNDKRAGLLRIQSYRPRKSKPIIDEIDKVLAKHYGFTDEELDFIINYDIKYRMGDELDNG